MSTLFERLKADMAARGVPPLGKIVVEPVAPRAFQQSELPSGQLSISGTLESDGPPSAVDIEKVQSEAQGDAKLAAETALKTAINGLVFFMDQYGAPRLQAHRNSGRLDCPHADSEDGGDYIRAKLQQATGKTASQSAVDAVIQQARAKARADQVRKHVHMRVASDGEDVVLDTANLDGDSIRIGAGGYGLEPQGSVLFHRGSGTGALPEPKQMPPERAYEVLQDFAASHGVSMQDVPAFIVSLVEYIRPGSPHPILELVGPAGSRKSSTAREVISIFDPTQNGEIPSGGVNEPDVMAAATNRYALHADNLSRLDTTNQDLLCRISTGGELAARRLYTQREQESIHVQRPMVITAITSVLTRSDARSRTITIALKPPSAGYKSEGTVRQEFAAIHAELLGAICSLLSAGLAHLRTVQGQRLYTHRMADFEQLGEAIHQALGRAPGWFGTVLADRRRTDAKAIVEGDPVLTGLLKVVSKWEADASMRLPSQPTGRALARAGVGIWEGQGVLHIAATVTKWLEASKREMPFDPREQPPANERAFKSAVDHRIPTLEALGWKVIPIVANDRAGIALTRKVTA